MFVSRTQVFVQDAFQNYITEQDHVYIFLFNNSFDFVKLTEISIVRAYIMHSKIWQAPRQCCGIVV